MADIVTDQGGGPPSTMQTRYRDMGDGTHALVLSLGGVVVAVAEPIVTGAAWLIPVNGEVFNAVQTAYNSNAINTEGWSALNVLIAIDSTLAPTDIRVIAQFSHDNGVTWWRFEEGLWASLYWEDTDTALGVQKAFLLPCAGIDRVRLRVVATGTDANNRFDVTIRVRAFRGNFATAHA